MRGLPSENGTVEGPSGAAIPAILLMLLGPSAAGLLLTATLDGRLGLTSLWMRWRRWRIGWRWYAFLLVTPVALLLVYVPLALRRPEFTPAVVSSDGGIMALLAGLAVGLGAGFLEEWGWTGFATPRLLRRYSWLVVGVVLGVPWAVWHLLADHWGSINAYGEWYVPHFLLWIMALTAFRVLMVRAYAGTQSLLLVQLMHASFTGSQATLGPSELSAGASVACYAAFAAVLCVVVTVVALAGRRRCTPQPLPMQPAYQART